jgi:hypothetical protein
VVPGEGAGRVSEPEKARYSFRDSAPATTEIAGIFALNLATWRDDPWVVAHHGPRLDALAAGLRERQAAADDGRIRWMLRQVTIAR